MTYRHWMPLDAGQLHYDLTMLALDTWDKIDSGDRQNLRFREDSITDHNLWKLAQQHSGLAVHRFDQSAEHATGADWEWWVGSDALGWVAMRIQAKRVDARSYRQLGHPGERDDEYQYDTLLRSCRADAGATYPLHVFYNGWPDTLYGGHLWPPGTPVLGCQAGCRGAPCMHVQVKSMGCAVASTSTVKLIHESGLRRNRLVRSYLPYSLPWAELFGLWQDMEDLDEPVLGWFTEKGYDSEYPGSYMALFLQRVLEALGNTPGAADFWPTVLDPREEGSMPPLHPHLPDYANAVRYSRRQPVYSSQFETLPAAPLVSVIDVAHEGNDG